MEFLEASTTRREPLKVENLEVEAKPVTQIAFLRSFYVQASGELHSETRFLSRM